MVALAAAVAAVAVIFGDEILAEEGVVLEIAGFAFFAVLIEGDMW